ncbi:MAG: phosphoribosylaminoimidazolecarboxamide formyltransferase [Chloroflexota bacterium]
MTSSLTLRYGTNPQQSPARVMMKNGSDLPFSVLGGSPGYINLLDAMNAWQLVRELQLATGLPAAASFKHVSPSGAAAAVPLPDVLKKSYFTDDASLSPLAEAYARARGVDRMSSFGDFVALSSRVDISAAKLIAREVSDGVIAPDYDPDALEILKQKKGGKYVVLKMDPAYEPGKLEQRDVFGITFEQNRYERPVTAADLTNIVTIKKSIPAETERDMLIAWITLKYTQSNSVCLVLNGQTIGVGAGQQSRVHCVRLAAAKADLWYLRQHPRVLDLPFIDGINRADRDNAIDQYLQPAVTAAEMSNWKNVFKKIPRQLSEEERRSWLDTLTGVTLGSDAFFPFRDSIDRAAQTGVKYVLQPGGSNRDAEVIAACDHYGMSMVFTGIRLFHH